MFNVYIEETILVKWPEEINNEFIKRTVDAMPPDFHMMAKLAGVLDIRYSDKIDTACISYMGIPKIWINYDFITKHAKTWSHIAMILAHEITHKMLMHDWEDIQKFTGRSLNADQQNILFDVRVQGLNYQMMPEPAYQSFWWEYYRKSEFPINFLNSGAKFERYIHRTLHEQIYSPMGVSLDRVADIIFDESISGGPEDWQVSQGDFVPFVGNHDHENDQYEEEAALDKSYESAKEIREFLDEKVEKFIKQEEKKARREAFKSKDATPIEIRQLAEMAASSGYSHNESVYIKMVKDVEDKYYANKAMEDRMKDIAVTSMDIKAKKTIREMFDEEMDVTAIPNFRDSRAVALYDMGIWPMFFKNEIEDTEQGLCHIYMDASGSQFHVIDFIIKLMASMRDYVYPKVHFFSDVIYTVDRDELEDLTLSGIETTGGTSFDAVVKHSLDNNIDKCLVITDGISSISDENVEKSKRRRQKHLIGFTHEKHGVGFDALAWKEFDIPYKEEK